MRRIVQRKVRKRKIVRGKSKADKAAGEIRKAAQGYGKRVMAILWGIASTADISRQSMQSAGFGGR